MRIAALILGILGGLAGLAGATFAFMLGGLVASSGQEEVSAVLGHAGGALGFSILGIIGAALAGSKAKTSGTFMLVSAIGGTIAISYAYIVAAPLLFVGGILAFFSGKREG